jgi:hypothetical protein
MVSTALVWVALVEDGVQLVLVETLVTTATLRLYLHPAVARIQAAVAAAQ